MTERNIAAEVLDGLREIREYRAGKRTLRTIHIEPRPLPELTPDAIRRIRESLDVSRAIFAHMIRVPVRTVEGWEQGRSSPPGLRHRAHSHGAEIPRHVRAPGLALAGSPAWAESWAAGTPHWMARQHLEAGRRQRGPAQTRVYPKTVTRPSPVKLVLSRWSCLESSM